MLKAIVYKEWLKTRWLIIGFSVLAIGLLGYIFISLGRIFRLMKMVEVWDTIINRHSILYSELKYYPIAFGLLLALAQFVPEMQKKCLKLTLHLPISQRKSYFGMQTYGLLVLLFSFTIGLVILYLYSNIYFPREIIANTFLTLLPWYSAGITTYIFTALICLEPNWGRKTIYLFIALGVVYISFLKEFPACYEKIWWIFMIIPIYIFTFPWLSIERFKKGVQ